MIYADYDYYTKTYMGNAIAEEEYPRLATRAAKYLDYITMGRAEKNAGLEAVKMCACALAEQYKTIEAANSLSLQSLQAGTEDTAEVQSESVGSWSRSYRSGGDSAQSASNAAQTARAALMDTALMYLGNTGLLRAKGYYA